MHIPYSKIPKTKNFTFTFNHSSIAMVQYLSPIWFNRCENYGPWYFRPRLTQCLHLTLVEPKSITRFYGSSGASQNVVKSFLKEHSYLTPILFPIFFSYYRGISIENRNAAQENDLPNCAPFPQLHSFIATQSHNPLIFITLCQSPEI